MGHFVTSNDIPADGERLEKSKVAKWKLISLAVFVVGAIASAFFLFFTPESMEAQHQSFTYSWLLAFYYFLTLSVGGCFWLLLHHVTNSGWGVSIRRLMENLALVFPAMAIMAIPLLFPGVQEHLYEWMNEHRYAAKYDIAAKDLGLEGGKYALKDISNEQSAEVAKKVKEIKGESFLANPSKYALYQSHNALLAAKGFYMNLPFWLGRIAAFFGLLGGSVWLLRHMSIKQDSDPNADCKRLIKSRRMSCWMMPIFAVSATFLAFDFLMGIDFKWFSTMWGVYIFAGCAINSMAVLILTLTALRKMGYMKKVTSPEHYHIMGKLMHAFVIFWAYVTFSQFMLIWYAAITEETAWFILRNTDMWNTWQICLVIFHFAVPFVLLLPHYVKKKTYLIVPICLYLLVMHAIDLYLIIMPERGPSLTAMNYYAGKGGEISLFTGLKGELLLDILAFVTVGAFFVFVFLRNLTSANLYPNRDPRIIESANLHN